MILKQYIGDSHTHTIPLTWNGAAFSPGASWVLIFTLKERSTDADADAIAQKTNGLGLEISGTNALISLVPTDTDALEPAPLYRHFDVQAQHIDTGEIRTVAIGQFTLQRDITRLPQTSVPIHTTEEPQPAGPFTPAAHAASHATGGDDEITPASIGAAASSHNQAISTITGLQTALDGKAASSHTHDVLKSADGTPLVKVGTDYTGEGGSRTGVEQGLNCTANGDYSHAEGDSTTASGAYSHTEGASTQATGEASHAEGAVSVASGYASHAEGANTTASEYASHAEGANTTASGYASHAEGSYSLASGTMSRASGRQAKAIHDGASVETDTQDVDCVSTIENQKTFRFANGYRFLGGIADFFAGIGTNSKTTPIDADSVVINDSAASSEAKKLTFANLWTWIKSKMETASGILLPLTNGGTGATTAKGAVTKLTTVVDDANTTIALSATNDTGYIKRCTAGTAIGITTPSTDPGDGWSMMFIQAGAGQITFNPYSGSTINSYGNLTKTAGQHAVASLVRVSANTYNLSGNLA